MSWDDSCCRQGKPDCIVGAGPVCNCNRPANYDYSSPPLISYHVSAQIVEYMLIDASPPDTLDPPTTQDLKYLSSKIKLKADKLGIKLENFDETDPQTVIRISAQQGKSVCVQLLLDSGVDAQNNEGGMSAFYLAIANCRKKTVTTIMLHKSFDLQKINHETVAECINKIPWIWPLGPAFLRQNLMTSLIERLIATKNTNNLNVYHESIGIMPSILHNKSSISIKVKLANAKISVPSGGILIWRDLEFFGSSLNYLYTNYEYSIHGYDCAPAWLLKGVRESLKYSMFSHGYCCDSSKITYFCAGYE